MSSSMSLLRPPPAATARRGAELAGLLEPKSPESSEPKLPPPPPLRPSSMVRVELKPCSTTSVEYFSTPLWSVHLRVCSAPSMYTLAPFFRYCSATLQSPSLKITTRCHSVFSLRSPVPLSRQVSDVAMLRLAIGRPSCVRRISGSLPRLPTRITLFTLPAIAALHSISPAKIPVRPLLFRPPSILDLSLCPLFRHRFRTSGANLYAGKPRRLSDPSASRRLSTYSIAPTNVPALFRKPRAAIGPTPYATRQRLEFASIESIKRQNGTESSAR